MNSSKAQSATQSEDGIPVVFLPFRRYWFSQEMLQKYWEHGAGDRERRAELPRALPAFPQHLPHYTNAPAM